MTVKRAKSQKEEGKVVIENEVGARLLGTCRITFAEYNRMVKMR